MTYIPVRRPVQLPPPADIPQVRVYRRRDDGHVAVISCAPTGRQMVITFRPNPGRLDQAISGHFTVYQYGDDDPAMIESAVLLDLRAEAPAMDGLLPIPIMCLPGPAFGLVLRILSRVNGHLAISEMEAGYAS